MKKDPKERKSIKWLGNSLDELRSWPTAVTQDVGAELLAIQEGRDPSDWKPIPIIGAGVKELRIADSNNQYRVVYLAKFMEAIYVLHAFEKKTQKTSPRDLNLAEKRYKELTKVRREAGK